jgi:folate-binding protein YgfZ
VECVVDTSSRARVRLTGPDARAFLHRLSTQHVKDLGPGDGRLNALLTDKGRLVDVVHHLDRGDDGVLLVGSPGKGPDVYAWLDRYLFSEKVELHDMSAQGSCADVVGGVDSVVPGASSLPPWGFRQAGSRIAIRSFGPLFIVVDLEAADVAAAVPLPRAADLEAFRVAQGIPGAGEITDAFTPLDLGLHDAIHWAKGCYIGQEVIARLDTYQKQHKRLVVVDGPAARGAQVKANGAVAGVVTSSAGDHALAVVKLPDDGPVEIDGKSFVAHTPAVTQAAHD